MLLNAYAYRSDDPCSECDPAGHRKLKRGKIPFMHNSVENCHNTNGNGEDFADLSQVLHDVPLLCARDKLF